MEVSDDDDDDDPRGNCYCCNCLPVGRNVSFLHCECVDCSDPKCACFNRDVVAKIDSFHCAPFLTTERETLLKVKGNTYEPRLKRKKVKNSSASNFINKTNAK